MLNEYTFQQFNFAVALALRGQFDDKYAKVNDLSVSQRFEKMNDAYRSLLQANRTDLAGLILDAAAAEAAAL